MNETQVTEQPTQQPVERVWRKNIVFLPHTKVVGTNGDNQKQLKCMADGTVYEVRKDGSWKNVTKQKVRK